MPGLKNISTIAAPPERVWAVLADVERWPEHIPTVTTAQRLDDGPLHVGARTRLKQPKLSEAVWTVTELVENRSFTWVSKSPGVTISAEHLVEPHENGTRLTLSLLLTGPLAGFGWLLTRSMTRRYVAAEAASIKKAAE